MLKKFQNVEEIRIRIQKRQTVHRTAKDRERWRQTNRQTESLIRGKGQEKCLIQEDDIIQEKIVKKKVQTKTVSVLYKVFRPSVFNVKALIYKQEI